MNDAAQRFRASLEKRIAEHPKVEPHPSLCPPRAGGRWPWPFFRLSNGFEIELNEVLRVRCLRDFDGSQGAVARVGDVIAVRAEPRWLELVKFGRGNRRYLNVQTPAIEGRDFEVIASEKMWLINDQARSMAGMTDEALAARQERECGPHTQD
jgi:hypothetical protein